MVEWIESFWSKRYHKVVIDGRVSFLALILSGVPQGTILGPILFLIFINDIETCVLLSTICCFADDTRVLQGSIIMPRSLRSPKGPRKYHYMVILQQYPWSWSVYHRWSVLDTPHSYNLRQSPKDGCMGIQCFSLAALTYLWYCTNHWFSAISSTVLLCGIHPKYKISRTSRGYSEHLGYWTIY